MYRVILAVTNDIVTDYRVHKVAKTLKRNGYSVTIVGRRFSYSEDLFRRPYRTRRFKLWVNKGVLFYAAYNIRLFFYLMAVKFDVIVANDLDTLPSSFVAAKLKRKPLVYDSHELFTEVPELQNRPFVKSVWSRFEKLLVPRVKHAYTVSQSVADHYKDHIGVEFDVVRNVGRFRYGHEFEHVKQRDEKVILYQGAVNIGRGLDLIIRAMKELPRHKLWVIGSGDVLEEMKELTVRCGVEEQVLFVGRVPFEKLWKYTSQADVGLSIEEDLGLNYRYALPNKIFDYIQARLPMIVSDLPEMRKVVSQYGLGLILEERTPEKLAELILTLDEEKTAQLKSKLELAARELCWQIEEEKLVHLYRKIIQPELEYIS